MRMPYERWGRYYPEYNGLRHRLILMMMMMMMMMMRMMRMMVMMVVMMVMMMMMVMMNQSLSIGPGRFSLQI